MMGMLGLSFCSLISALTASRSSMMALTSSAGTIFCSSYWSYQGSSMFVTVARNARCRSNHLIISCSWVFDRILLTFSSTLMQKGQAPYSGFSSSITSSGVSSGKSVRI